MTDDALIYLDHNATTPVDPRVVEAMLPFFGSDYGNPASRQHAAGRCAALAVDGARASLAGLLGADPREIVWTSGATEANNLALKGVAAAPAYVKRRHLVTVTTEHKAVLDPCARLEERGFEVTRLGVDGEGRIDLQELEAALRADTLLVSVMHANNETGVLQPLESIGRICTERRVLFHTDATQSFGKEPIDVNSMGIDLLSLSAHKFYGPKGVGALFVRRKGPRVRCAPLLEGGGHERGLRSGTLNVPGIVGLVRAAEWIAAERVPEQARLARLRDAFERALMEELGGVLRNGPAAGRLAGTTNLSFEGCDGESLMRRMPGVAASSSAACTSSSLQPSYVLRALGASQKRIEGSLRFSLGRDTRATELERAQRDIVQAVRTERAQGPLQGCDV